MVRYASAAMTVQSDRSILAGIDGAMAGTPILRAPPGAAIGELVDRENIRHSRKGTYLFYQGDESGHVYFLIKGRVEVSSLSVTGHRQLHTTLDGPQFFGELGVLGELRRTATALA